MELRTLRYFVAVAQELHFGRAAGLMNISQPPLTRQIQNLEKELKVILLHRTKRRVELTTAGGVFLRHALEVLAAAEEAANAAQRSQRGEMGRLVVGYFLSMTYSPLPAILRLFRKRVPDAELVLQEMGIADMPDALSKRMIDVGFLRPPVANAGIVTRVLMREPFVIALPTGHPLARRQRIGLAKLASEPFITFTPSRSVIHHQVMGACHDAGFQPRVVQAASHRDGVLGLVRSGVGIAIVPDSARRQGGDGVEFRELTGAIPKVELAMAWRRSDVSPLVRTFTDVARHAVREQLKSV